MPTSGVNTMTSADARIAANETIGELEIVDLFDGARPTGVSVAHAGGVLVCFSKRGDDVGFTVGEIRDGELVAYPGPAINNNDGDAVRRAVPEQRAAPGDLHPGRRPGR